jgi:hypothetical protein
MAPLKTFTRQFKTALEIFAVVVEAINQLNLKKAKEDKFTLRDPWQAHFKSSRFKQIGMRILI